jgi:hypothetical protein
MDRELGRVVIAVEHARAEQHDGVVEKSALAFLDGVHLRGDARDHPEEVLVHFEPVGGVGMAQQVMNDVVDPDVRESERGVVIVELERRDPRRVGLESEHEQVAHELHVLVDILREPILRPFKRWSGR